MCKLVKQRKAKNNKKRRRAKHKIREYIKLLVRFSTTAKIVGIRRRISELFKN